MLAKIISLTALIGLVAAAPTIVPTSVCTTVRSGPLLTTGGQHVSVFADGFVIAGGDFPATAEIQSCQPNFGGYDGSNGGPVGGHIYIPQIQRCLRIDSSDSLTVIAQPCEYVDDSRQIFANWVDDSDGNIYFAGGTRADGSYIFKGDTCPSGLFGLASNATNNYALQLSCSDDAGVEAFTI